MKQLNKIIEGTSSSGTDAFYSNKKDKKGLQLCKPLPNVSRFEIDLSKYDQVFKKYGLSKRLPYIITEHTSYKPSEWSRIPGTIHIVPHTNKRINKYLRHQSRRLNLYRNNTNLFWVVAISMIKRSDSFLISTLNKSLPQWHRKQPIVKVLRAIQEFKKLRMNSREIDFRRVWIPKDVNDLARGLRPLGVPTDAWRIYSAMWAQILKIWLQDFYPKEQHGFFPGRGTLTAWRSIIEHAFPSRNITGFDLKTFFDGLSLKYISKQLSILGTPQPIIDLLEDFNLSTPKGSMLPVLEKERKKLKDLRTALEKEKEMLRSATQDTLTGGFWVENLYRWAESEPELWDERMLQALRQEYGPYFRKPETGWTMWHGYICYKNSAEFRALEDYRVNDFPWEIANAELGRTLKKWQGIPQGAATSPLLSSLVTQGCLFPYIEGLIMYADDGVIFSDSPIELPELPSMREAYVSWNHSKTEVIKENGIWKKPLKFLGLEYDGTINKLRAKTRKGSTLLYDKEALVSAVQATEIGNKQYIRGLGKSWTDFFQSKILGYIQARLYAGSFDLANLEQDFSYTYKPGSWTENYPKKIDSSIGKPTVFNASSFANTWLLRRLKKTRKFH